MTEIICAGFGGQGILTAGMILIDAGMEQGKHVTFYPSYGSEMRGGTANCSVKISDKRIASPICKTLDILFTMNTPAIDKFEPRLKPGGLLLVNSSVVPAERQYRDDIRVVKVDAVDIAKEVIVKEVSEHSAEVAYSLAKELLDSLKDATKVLLKLNPEDYALIIKDFEGEDRIKIQPDKAIAKGGVVIMSDDGNLDGTIMSRFQTLKRTILENLAERN